MQSAWIFIQNDKTEVLEINMTSYKEGGLLVVKWMVLQHIDLQ